MIKKLFIYLTLLAGLSACSVEEIQAPSGLGADGELTVTLSVPEMETVGTRSDENKIKDVTMLVLSNSGVEQAETITLGAENNLGNNQYQIKKKLNQNLHSKSGLRLYFIANLRNNVKATDLMSYSEAQLKALTTTYFVNTSDQMMMSGVSNLSDIAGGSPVLLQRNAAKITVTDKQPNADGTLPTGTTEFPFNVYGTSVSSSIVAGALNGSEYIQDAVATDPDNVSFTGKTLDYLHYTKNPGRNVEARPFIIVKAKYPATGGSDYYYRLEFERYDQTTKKFEALNILPNHHYQVVITEVTGKGYPTPQEAMKNPSSLIMATIYDYSPQAYNMVTDGLRELGVTGQLLHNGEPTTGGTPEYIYIKVYSPDAADYNSPAQAIKISASESWLSFGTMVKTTDSGTPLPGADSFKGQLFRVPVHFNKTKEPGELDAVITVIWKGLQREIPVKWTRDFDPSELCDVQLTIKDASGTAKYTSTNYWADIANTSLFGGLSVEENEGKIRNQGLHFPVNYGGPSARWKYEYKVSFHNLNDGHSYDWRVVTTGLQSVTITPASGNNVTGEAEFTVTHDNTLDNWDYKVGTLKFELRKPGETKWTDYEIDLYHTGFFDNPKRFRNTDHRMDTPEKDFFYYYEVIKGPGTNDYWLDRNLGATSSAYYIEKEGADPEYFGKSESAGGYYSVAAYNNGGNPTMYTDICPPGFQIPKVEEWNNMRNSPDFVTTQSGTYYRAEYTNANGQKINFPRCRFYNNDNSMKTGESRAGYYWSRTAANGLEKDQIGNWLRYLKFSGSIASYDNGQVNGRRGSKGSAMSVRCINVTSDPTVIHRTYFNVSGATHVFLYSVDDQGNRNPVTNWPGKAIGNYVTMGNSTGTGSGTQVINFSYESPNTPASEFYVMFTFRDKNGIWHTMSKGKNGQTVYSNDKNPRDLTGWKVIGDNWDGKSTVLNGFWRCHFDGNTAVVNYSEPQVTPPVIDPVPDIITLYYTNPSNWGQVYIYAWGYEPNGDKVENGGWPGVLMTKENDGRYSYRLNRNTYKQIIFNGGNGQPQTKDITLEQEDEHVYTNGPQ